MTDDGDGFDSRVARSGHHGLSGMQFRAESLGGAMHLHSAPGQGTVVWMEFPEVQANPVPHQAAAS